MVRVFHDEDADLDEVKEETVAVLGYGIQGRAQALNLRDSGLSVIVGNREDDYRKRAHDDGFPVFSIAEAAARGDIVIFLIPDEAQPEVYERDVRPGLEAGNALVFGHGFAVRYGLVRPPPDVDLCLLAPRMPGGYVREFFLQGRGVPAFVHAQRDATRRALKRVLALAKGIGATRAGCFEVTFSQETELDHFSEHFTYPLIVRALELAFEFLMEEGYPPEAALMELHGSGELGEVLGAASRMGLHGMLETHASPACQVGIHSHTDRVFAEGPARRLMKEILGEIRDGTFARALVEEQEAGYPDLKQKLSRARSHPLVEVEASLRRKLRGFDTG
ncbi:MAG: ketol-acid reductoisomerase [Nitrospinota bacterium]